MKNKWMKICLGILCFLMTSIVFTACKQPNNSDSGSSSEEPPVSQESGLTLNYDSRTLSIGDRFALIASFSEIEGASLNWSSSDPSVATVENGFVTAVLVGTCEITATYGEWSDTCEVIVSSNGILPTLVFEQGFYDGETIKVDIRDSINILAQVSFNGKTFDDGAVDYQIVDPTMGRVENGVFIPTKTGETEVIVTATWRGISSPMLSAAFVVEVLPYRAILLDGGYTNAITLSAVPSLNGVEYENTKSLEIEAHENATTDKEYSVELLDNEGVVVYEETTRTVRALKYGTAILKISFTTEDNTEFSATFPVKVTRPITDYSKTVELFSQMDGELPVEEIFGYSTTIVDATQEENADIYVDEGKVMAVKLTNDDAISTETIVIYDDYVGYRIKLEAATKVIDSVEDLRIFSQTEDTQQKLTGYYVLATNIVDMEHVYNEERVEVGYGFGGTFDGMGHYITATVGYGFFNRFMNGATVKNTAFVDMKLSSSIGRASNKAMGVSVIFYDCGNSNYTFNLTDVYVSVGESWFDCTNSYGHNLVSLLKDNYGGMKATNVVFEVETPESYTYAPDLMARNWGAQTLNNVYVISSSVGNVGGGTATNDKIDYAGTFKNTTNRGNYLPGETYPNTNTSVTDGKSGTIPGSATNLGFYTDWGKFAEAVQAETAFTNDCWTIKEDGSLIWSALVDNRIAITKPIVFSGYTGTDADANDQAIKCAELEGTIVGVYLATDVDMENNYYDATTGKVNLTNASNTPMEYSVIIETTENEYRATLEVWTRVLYTKEDLRMFDQGTSADGLRKIVGCYALGADIVDTEITYNQKSIAGFGTSSSKWYDRGFAGTFDGKGHYVTFKCVNGLFNYVLYGAEIRNVAFVDIATSTGGTVLGSGTGLYYQYTNNTKDELGLTSDDMVVNVSNVYMSLGEGWYNNSTASILVGDGDARKHVSYENVIIELSAPPADYTAAPDLVSKIATFSAGETAFKAGFTNVYVVGATTNADTDAKRTDLYKTVGGVIVTTDGVKMGTDYSVIANADTIFTSDCWTIVDGKPVWATLNEAI